jgi:hypothetical protein
MKLLRSGASFPVEVSEAEVLPPPSAAHVVGGTETRIVFEDGACAVVLASYPEHRGLVLHSLAVAVLFYCTSCRRQAEATVLATRGAELVCPGCYGWLGSDEAATEPDLVPGEGIPVQRLTGTE